MVQGQPSSSWRGYCVRLAALGFCGPLMAQAPLLQDGADRLRREGLDWIVQAPPREDRSAWLEAGGFGDGRTGTLRAPLVGGEGLGTSTQGAGALIAFQLPAGGWTFSGIFAAQKGLQGDRDALVLLEGGITYRTGGGWRFGLTQSPFTWGPGQTGGYLMGTSARPFPRFFAESRPFDLSLWGVPLGRWRAETFIGRLEWQRELPDDLPNAEHQKAALAQQGDIRRPDLSGLRLTGQFGPHIELGMGLVSMWGGVQRDGRSTRAGYSAKDYLLGYFGAENIAEVESSSQFNEAAFKAISDAIAAVDVKVRIPALARLAGAEGAVIYLSRGAENVNWQWKDFLKHPLRAIGHDLSHDWRQFRKGPRRWFSSDLESFWGYGRHESVPSLEHVNDVLGVQWVWTRSDLAVEYADTRNIPWQGSGYRTYSHNTYLSGYSRYGDFLGMAFGGDVITRTVAWGLRSPEAWQGRLLVTDGIKAYRDTDFLWNAAHPGQTETNNRFLHLQAEAQWRGPGHRLGFTLGWMRNSARAFVPGARAEGWTGLASWSVRFPR